MMEGVQVKAAQSAPDELVALLKEAEELLKPAPQKHWQDAGAVFDQLAHPNDLQLGQNGDVMIIPANAPAWEIHPIDPLNLPANLQDEQMPSFEEEE